MDIQISLERLNAAAAVQDGILYLSIPSEEKLLPREVHDTITDALKSCGMNALEIDAGVDGMLQKIEEVGVITKLYSAVMRVEAYDPETAARTGIAETFVTDHKSRKVKV